MILLLEYLAEIVMLKFSVRRFPVLGRPFSIGQHVNCPLIVIERFKALVKYVEILTLGDEME